MTRRLARLATATKLSRILTGTLAGALFQTLILLSPVGAESLVLGVVRSQDNAPRWEEITTRLQAARIAYRTIDLQEVSSAADLAGINVLFLPNIETLSPAQVAVLEAWINQGGRVIASGPVGRQSPLSVRQSLRSLLGAYWSFPLAKPATLQPAATSTESWLRQGVAASRIEGGALIPTDGNSQTVAIWNKNSGAGGVNSGNTAVESPPAVITTERSTFLGWNWGGTVPGTVAFDSVWLKAALSRYGNLPTTTVKPNRPPIQGTSAVLPTVSLPNTPAIQPVARPPVPSVSTGSRPTPTLQRIPGLGSQPQPTPRQSPEPNPALDPAEQVAPPGLAVESSALPITPLEAIAMRQELENLIGRVESALLSANAFGSPATLQVDPNSPTAATSASDKLLVASTTDVSVSKIDPSEATTASTVGVPAIQALSDARQLIRSFPELIAQQNYATARQQWLQARQTLWESYPTDRPSAQPEIRAVWLDRGTIVRAGSEQGLTAIFDRLAAAGINTVFLETVNAGYPIYPSKVAPQQNPLTLGWDPLASAVKLAHARGMELHAWVWVFAIGNQRHNLLLNLPANYPGPVLAAHPDWANYDNRGNVIPVGQNKPFLDPANPEVRSYLLRLYKEIVTQYKVDGLQLDYIRYPFQDPGAGRTYGYGKAARQQFQQLTGVDPLTLSPRDREIKVPAKPPKSATLTVPPPDPELLRQQNRELWRKWTEFRTQQINSFVAEVSSELRQVRPGLILSAAVFSFSEHERIQKLQQHWEVWASQGDVDLIVPMAYAADTNRFQRLVQPWLTQARLSSTLVLPGIFILNLPETATVDQIQALRDMPAGGYSLFAVEHLSDRLQMIFNRTQGSRQQASKEPIPYRDPFATAAARYAGMQREWNFLLANNQLWMREPELTNWRAQAKKLEQALDQLATKPSAYRLTNAKQALTEFRAQFPTWMRLQTLNQKYQVRTWENRLMAIETLLRYGERMTLKSSNR